VRKLCVGSVLTFAALLVALGPAPAAFAAKPHSDPPFTIPKAVCGFPVLVEIPVDGEQSKTTTLPDGTTVTSFEGPFKESLTNTETGKTINVNASGPGTVTQAAGSSVQQIASLGVATTYVTNGADFGLPNFFYYSGPFDFTTDTSNDTLASVSQFPHVKADLCAALS
jgi:hypothetical protein